MGNLTNGNFDVLIGALLRKNGIPRLYNTIRRRRQIKKSPLGRALTTFGRMLILLAPSSLGDAIAEGWKEKKF